MSHLSDIKELLGKDAGYLLDYKSHTFDRNNFYFPTPDFVDNVVASSDRSDKVLHNLKSLYQFGRLENTGYLSIFPVDQGVEHSAGARFADNPLFFDPKHIVRFAIEAGCNGVASTLGVLGAVCKDYADKIPFIVKLNHNELLSYPNTYDQVMYARVEQAYNLGAIGVGATVYFGSQESSRQLGEVSRAFARAHELGMFTVLWCYLRNDAFGEYQTSADLTGQANYLGATIQADIIKQKMPTTNGGYTALKYGKSDPKIYSELTTDHPIDLLRYQLANCYMGRVPLINSGGDAGNHDLADVVRDAVINKRAGGSGLIVGRKAFQKPWEEGIDLMHAVQNVYLTKEITIA